MDFGHAQFLFPQGRLFFRERREADFLAKLKGIEGISSIETQTYTLEEALAPLAASRNRNFWAVR